MFLKYCNIVSIQCKIMRTSKTGGSGTNHGNPFILMFNFWFNTFLHFENVYHTLNSKTFCYKSFKSTNSNRLIYFPPSANFFTRCGTYSSAYRCKWIWLASYSIGFSIMTLCDKIDIASSFSSHWTAGHTRKIIFQPFDIYFFSMYLTNHFASIVLIYITIKYFSKVIFLIQSLV